MSRDASTAASPKSPPSDQAEPRGRSVTCHGGTSCALAIGEKVRPYHDSSRRGVDGAPSGLDGAVPVPTSFHGNRSVRASPLAARSAAGGLT
jgi:hypothetical protein